MRNFLFVGSLLFAGCAANSDVEDVQTDTAATEPSDFSVMANNGWTLLPSIEQSNGAFEVCLGLLHYPSDDARAVAAEKLKARLESVMNQWNALLADDPDWSLKAPITPSYTVQATPCAKGLRGMGVNVWATVESFKADYCVPHPTWTCASGGAAWDRLITLGPWNRTQEVDPLDPFTVLHEYGHMLGLGDTYRIPGWNDWIGVQPPSVMNGGVRDHLTDDDKLGLWATVRAIKSGKRDCDGFGHELEMTANAWHSFMCAPGATPVTTH